MCRARKYLYSVYHKLCWTFELFLLSEQTLVILQFSTFDSTFIVLIVTWQFDDAEIWMMNIRGLIIFYQIDEGGFYNLLVIDCPSLKYNPPEELYWLLLWYTTAYLYFTLWCSYFYWVCGTIRKREKYNNCSWLTFSVLPMDDVL